MKHLSTFSFVFALLLVTLAGCKKEKTGPDDGYDLPAPNAASTFTLTVDGKTYNMRIKGQLFKMADTARVRIDAVAPEITIRLEAEAPEHVSGTGEYYLACCNNDVFDQRTTAHKHWEIDHIGNRRQNGTIKITRMDSKGYEGSYTIYGNDYAISRNEKKEFKGTFVVIY